MKITIVDLNKRKNHFYFDPFETQNEIQKQIKNNFLPPIYHQHINMFQIKTNLNQNENDRCFDSDFVICNEEMNKNMLTNKNEYETIETIMKEENTIILLLPCKINVEMEQNETNNFSFDLLINNFVSFEHIRTIIKQQIETKINRTLEINSFCFQNSNQNHLFSFDDLIYSCYEQINGQLTIRVKSEETNFTNIQVQLATVNDKQSTSNTIEHGNNSNTKLLFDFMFTYSS
jgi:hypothetical protein